MNELTIQYIRRYTKDYMQIMLVNSTSFCSRTDASATLLVCSRLEKFL
jgi:hypothetical protein